MAGNFVSKIQVFNYRCDQILSDNEIIDVALPCSCDYLYINIGMLLGPVTSQLSSSKLKSQLDAVQPSFYPVCHLHVQVP